MAFGNNLLCHYDMWLDLKNMQMYASIIDDYITPFEEYCSSNDVKHIFIQRTLNGRVVLYVSPEHVACDAGFRKGDVILSADGKHFSEIQREDMFEFDGEHKEHYIKILRGLDTLILKVLSQNETSEAINAIKTE